MKFFQIGFNRCGTTSICNFFNRSGIACIHFDGGRLAAAMQRNLEAGLPVMHGYDTRFDAFTDLSKTVHAAEHDGFQGFFRYREIMRDYPESRFILNTRDPERWIRSRLRHFRKDWPEYQAYYRHLYGTSDRDEIVARWRAEREEHHSNVIRDVPADRLLVFDIEKDDPIRLCRFAGLPESCASNYRRDNRYSPWRAWRARLLHPLRRRPDDP